MSTLHLNGTLDLSGSLILGGKVLVDGKEALVVTSLEKPNSEVAIPPVPPPKPEDPLIGHIWATKSLNTGVTVKGKALVVDGSECVQGSKKDISRTLNAKNCKVTIDKLAVVIEVTIDGAPVALTYSGQL